MTRVGVSRLGAKGLAAALMVLSLAGGVQAQGYTSYSCFQLWKQRNSIYKAAGYCFQTERARSYFGNQGCLSSNTYALPLTGGDRAAIAEIVQIERARGCRD